MSDPRQFCTFEVGDLFLGVEVLHVQEVIRFQELTRVPLSAPAVSGLINLRGQIVTAIDLRDRLGLGPRPEGTTPLNVVVRSDDGAVSLLVDRIGDVQEVEEESFEPPPETLRGKARSMISGAFKLEKRLLLHLDTERVISLDDEPSEVVAGAAT